MKKISLLILLSLFTTSLFSQEDAITSPVETFEEAPIEAPVELKEEAPEELVFDFSHLSEGEEESLEDLENQLKLNNKNYIMYQAFQYTSVAVVGLGLFMVILDAFVKTGSEYPFTPPVTDTRPNPTAVTTAFGNLSVAGAVVAVVGAAASIGFQFPYRKYRNNQFMLKNKIENLKKIEESESQLDNIINEVVVD